jgi:hypothetical protein
MAVKIGHHGLPINWGKIEGMVVKNSQLVRKERYVKIQYCV